MPDLYKARHAVACFRSRKGKTDSAGDDWGFDLAFLRNDEEMIVKAPESGGDFEQYWRFVESEEMMSVTSDDRCNIYVRE